MPIEKQTYRMICWEERIDYYGKSIARFAWKHKGSLLIALTIAAAGKAWTNEGLTVLDRQFSIKAYDPQRGGRLEGELALSMFSPSDESGQKQYDGLLVQSSTKNPYFVRINLARREFVPQSFISGRPRTH